MNNFLKVTAFSLFLIGVYTFFSDKLIPPITPEAPPKDEEVTAGSMTVEDFIRLGEKVFNGKGACTLCHNPVGGRAPSLDGIIKKAGGTIKEAGYRGGAKSAEEYVRESMANPSAYVVPGFGVTGSNDKVSPMPDVRAGEIGLSEVEIDSVIAYFQSAGGFEVTVGPPGVAAQAGEAR